MSKASFFLKKVQFPLTIVQGPKFRSQLRYIGEFIACPIPEGGSLEEREATLLEAGNSEDRESFLRFMRRVLQ
jgi:hypothetical protein